MTSLLKTIFNLDDKMDNILQNTMMKEVVLVIAAYGIIQVLAQDLGIKTGKKQRDLVQSQPIQIIVLFSGAYFVTQDFLTAGAATGMYYLLKYYYSKGKTSPVCFEEV